MCAESAVDGCARDTVEVELSLITRKFQVCNGFSAFRKKLPSDTRINLPVDCAKQFQMHDSLVHMQGL